MANITGLQPDIQFCPVCKGKLRNVPRNEMKSHAYKKKMGVFLNLLIHMNAWNAI
jgi:hypothetical protein